MADKYRPRSIFNNINVSSIRSGQDDGKRVYSYQPYYQVPRCDIFSLNGPIKYTLSGSCDESSAIMTLEEYLENHRSEYWMSNGFRIQGLRNFWLEKLDESLAEPEWYADGDLSRFSPDNSLHMNLLVFEVTFAPQSEGVLSISYPSFTFLSGRYGNTIYDEIYLLNPARYWAGFEGLEITIYTPNFAPYIVNSSLELTKAGLHTYTAYFDELPGDDLLFTMYGSEVLRTGILGFIQSGGIIGVVYIFIIITIVVFVFTRIAKNVKNSK